MLRRRTGRRTRGAATLGLALACLASTQVLAEDEKLLVEFDRTPLIEVVNWMSAKTGRNFVVPDELRDVRITIVSAVAVSKEGALGALKAALKAERIRVEETGEFTTLSRGGSRRGLPGCPSAEAQEAGIQAGDENHWKITRPLLTAWLQKADCVARQARIIPHFANGRARGFKIFGIRRGSFFDAVGLHSGDVILSLNGHSLSSPDDLLTAYEAVKSVDRFELEVERRGQELRFVYQIVERLSGKRAP